MSQSEIKAKLEHLKRKHAELLQQRIGLDRQIDECAMAIYQTERELKRNEKPTPLMLSVLRSLSNGATLTVSDLYNWKCWIEQEEGDNPAVRSSVFWGLRSREAIDDGKSSGVCRKTYSITPYGQEIVKKYAAADS